MTSTISTDEWPRLAFCGKAGAGKTTAAEFLEAGAGYQRHSIAGPLKDMAAKLWGPDGRTDRDKLQKLGQAVRAIDTEVWCRLTVQKIHVCAEMHNGNRPVIDDVRFPNEYYALKEAGFVIVRVYCPQAKRIDRLKKNGKWQQLEQLYDTSETAIDGTEFQPDYLLANDAEPDKFYEQLRRVLSKERSRV